MKIEKRNPKTDPKVGDIFQRGDSKRKILKMYKLYGTPMVHFHLLVGGNSKCVTRISWNKWVAGTDIEVIHHAGE